MKSLEEYLKKSLRQSTVKSYLYDIKTYLKSNKKAQKYDYEKVMQYIEILRNNYKINNIEKLT